jgi:hypothetical protein
MINKCAFVIPLHPKHYNYGYYILEYLFDKDVDLYFIFTDNNDKNIFLSKIKHPYNINFDNKYLILSDFCNIDIPKKTNSFVSIKKLFALSKLYTKYDYISCIDSEVHFIDKNNKYYDAMKKVVDAKIIFGGKVKDYNMGARTIIRDSLTKIINNKYHEQLRQISHDYKIFSWWSNLPVYDCKNAEHFLNWIDFNSNSLERFSWSVFDDLLYNYYCILIHNYRLHILHNFDNSLEIGDTQLIENVDKIISKLYWVNKKAYNQNKEYYINNDFIIAFHMDR